MSASEEYVRQFYSELDKNANDETVDNDTVRVFRGNLTTILKESGIDVRYYTRIRRVLLEYGCITYLQRGTRAYPSVLLLNHPPPEEISPSLLTVKRGDATLAGLAAKHAELEERITELEDIFEGIGGFNIGEALRNMERRLTKLERPTNGRQTTSGKKKSK